jgi:isoquinoline 1-oxidoreductase beta subunit
VGETFHDAHQGLLAVQVDWDETNAELRSSEELLTEHRRLVESGEQAVVARQDGDVTSALTDAAHLVDAVYELPYLAHGPMEPYNAVSRMTDDGVLEVWTGTEGPTYARMSAAAASGIDEDRIKIHVPFAGGSFGLHSTSGHDPISEAVHVAKALDWKYPIKLQSLREEEFKSGRYRAMAVHRVRAGADAGGRLTAFHQQIVAEPTSVNLPFVRDVMFTNGVDFFTTTVRDNQLQARNHQCANRHTDHGVAVGRQLPHRVRPRIGDRRTGRRRRPRPGRPASRPAGRQPAHPARA